MASTSVVGQIDHNQSSAAGIQATLICGGFFG